MPTPRTSTSPKSSPQVKSRTAVASPPPSSKRSTAPASTTGAAWLKHLLDPKQDSLVVPATTLSTTLKALIASTPSNHASITALRLVSSLETAPAQLLKDALRAPSLNHPPVARQTNAHRLLAQRGDSVIRLALLDVGKVMNLGLAQRTNLVGRIGANATLGKISQECGLVSLALDMGSTKKAAASVSVKVAADLLEAAVGALDQSLGYEAAATWFCDLAQEVIRGTGVAIEATGGKKQTKAAPCGAAVKGNQSHPTRVKAVLAPVQNRNDTVKAQILQIIQEMGGPKDAIKAVTKSKTANKATKTNKPTASGIPVIKTSASKAKK